MTEPQQHQPQQPWWANQQPAQPQTHQQPGAQPGQPGQKPWWLRPQTYVIAGGGLLVLFVIIGALNDGTTPTTVTALPTTSQAADNLATGPAEQANAAPGVSTTPEKAETAAVPKVVGRDLQTAQGTAQAAGFYLLTSDDLTSDDRIQVSDRDWKVCSQTPAGGKSVPTTTKLTFGVVKSSELCPGEKPKLGIGDPAKDEDFTFTVTKVERGPKRIGGSYGEEAQGKFILVHVKVKNTGSEAGLLADGSQYAFDAAGRKFEVDTAAGLFIEDNRVFLEKINPGNSVNGVLVFDVPKDVTLDRIELHESMFSAGITVGLK